MQDPVKEALNSGEWKEVLDSKTRRVYYYHPKSRRTTWDLAKELGVNSTPPTLGKDTAVNASTAPSQSAPLRPAAVSPLSTPHSSPPHGGNSSFTPRMHPSQLVDETHSAGVVANGHSSEGAGLTHHAPPMQSSFAGIGGGGGGESFALSEDSTLLRPRSEDERPPAARRMRSRHAQTDPFVPASVEKNSTTTKSENQSIAKLESELKVVKEQKEYWEEMVEEREKVVLSLNRQIAELNKTNEELKAKLRNNVEMQPQKKETITTEKQPKEEPVEKAVSVSPPAAAATTATVTQLTTTKQQEQEGKMTTATTSSSNSNSVEEQQQQQALLLEQKSQEIEKLRAELTVTQDRVFELSQENEVLKTQVERESRFEAGEGQFLQELDLAFRKVMMEEIAVREDQKKAQLSELKEITSAELEKLKERQENIDRSQVQLTAESQELKRLKALLEAKEKDLEHREDEFVNIQKQSEKTPFFERSRRLQLLEGIEKNFAAREAELITREAKVRHFNEVKAVALHLEQELLRAREEIGLLRGRLEQMENLRRNSKSEGRHSPQLSASRRRM